MSKLIINIILVLSVVVAQNEAKQVTFKTADQVSIAADLYVMESKLKQAAVILIHQGGSDRSEWTPFAKRLAKDYVVLNYDVRGHGKSDTVKSIVKLFNDPNLAPKDLQAAISYLQNLKSVDAKRIAVIGSSIGANLAYVASSEYDIKTAIALSGKTSAVYNLAGKKKLNMKSVFCIASSHEQKGKRAFWAKELHGRISEPRQLLIPESFKHGTFIMEDVKDLVDKMIDWLRKTL